MPQYLDHHPTIPDMPPEMVAFITQRLTSGQPDEFGEVGLHVVRRSTADLVPHRGTEPGGGP